MRALRRVAALLALLAGGPLPAAEVYKWVDEEGRVHYGDQAPSKGEAERLQIESAVTGVSIAPAQEGIGAPAPSSPDEQASTKTPDAPVPQAAAGIPRCHSSLEAVLGPNSALLADDALLPALTSEEQERVAALLRSVRGRWKADVVEVQCHDRPATPASMELRHQGDIHMDWPYRGPWILQARLEELEHRVVRDEVLWLQVEEGMLFAGISETTETTREQSRVAPLSVGEDHLSWARRYRQLSAFGQSVSRTELRTLRVVGEGYTLVEFFYVQDLLSAYRSWSIGK